MFGILAQAKAFADYRLAQHIARGEKGQGMVEYGLVLAAIGGAAVIMMTILGPRVIAEVQSGAASISATATPFGS